MRMGDEATFDPAEADARLRRVDDLARQLDALLVSGEAPADPALLAFSTSLRAEVGRFATEVGALMDATDERTRHMAAFARELQNQNETLRQQLALVDSLVHGRDRSASGGQRSQLLAPPEPAASAPGRGHRRVLSQHALEEVREAQEAERRALDAWEVDPGEYALFLNWRDADYPPGHAFLTTVIQTDVAPCLDFGPPAGPLAAAILADIRSTGVVALEPWRGEGEGEEEAEPERCALCPDQEAAFKLNLAQAPPLLVSRVVRNRVAAVCEMFHYVKFLRMQLPEYSGMEPKAIFLKLQRYRFEMASARLGYDTPNG